MIKKLLLTGLAGVILGVVVDGAIDNSKKDEEFFKNYAYIEGSDKLGNYPIQYWYSKKDTSIIVSSILPTRVAYKPAYRQLSDTSKEYADAKYLLLNKHLPITHNEPYYGITISITEQKMVE
jgi:hypothetical protein